MQEHPIPQDITNYRFHIVGSMTLKQFGEVLLGVLIAVVFYNTNLVAIVKWPLIIFSVGLGAAAAFVPFEERPLDHWIITFFKVLYKPTKFYWKREARVPDVFTHIATTNTIQEEPEFDLSPLKKQRIKEYVGSIREESRLQEGFTTEENLRMRGILDSFTQVTVQMQAQPQQHEAEKPSLGVRVRSMRKKEQVAEVVIFEDVPQENFSANVNIPTPITPEPFQTKKNSMLATDQAATHIEIPAEGTIHIKADDTQAHTESLQTPSNSIDQGVFIHDQKASTHNNTQPNIETTYNTKLPFPSKPTLPNVLVGMAITQNNEILPNTIVEIKTPQGAIERAVKTNALGQFFITTPLSAGEYIISAENGDFVFSPMKITLTNNIVDPIEIRSQN